MKRALIAQRGGGKAMRLIAAIVAVREILPSDLLQKHNTLHADPTYFTVFVLSQRSRAAAGWVRVRVGGGECGSRSCLKLVNYVAAAASQTANESRLRLQRFRPLNV